MNILILSATAYGHVIPFVQLSKLLHSRGHKLTLGYQLNKLSGSYHGEDIDLLDIYVPIWQTKASVYYVTDRWMFLKEILKEAVDDHTFHFALSSYVSIVNKIREGNFDSIVVDKMLSYLIPLLPPDLLSKAIVVNTMMNSYRSTDNTPLNSLLSPDDYSFRLRRNLQWSIYNIRTRLRKALFIGYSDIAIVQRIIVRVYGKKRISMFMQQRECFGHLGLKEIKEFSVGIKELDFSQATDNSHCQYLNLLSAEQYFYLQRGVTWITKSTIDKMMLSHTKLIYVSFGTLANFHERGVYKFFEVLCSVALKNPHWMFIYTYGGGELPDKDIVVDNLITRKMVDQRLLLSEADLVITHGGLGTIKESIMHETPMLVVPLSDYWDQKGNAARIKYHGLGKILSTKKFNDKNLIRTLLDLLDEKNQYHARISAFRATVTEATESIELLEHAMIANYNNQK